jgi:HPt (histidine-containing phosphotransfer) domain-containing protein
MNSSRLLLVEEDPARATTISSALAPAEFECFHAGSLADAKEALSLQQFDVILVSTLRNASGIVSQLSPLAKRFSPPALVLVYGECQQGICDGALPASLPPASLAREINRFCQLAALDQDCIAARLTMFDLLAFRQQMGEDTDLMSEIINIFFEESVGQLQELRQALSTQEFNRASRVAHSLKGSLGSLHAAQAKHWAQALEAASAACDGNRCEYCLVALEKSISALQPQLQQLLGT